MAASLQVFQNKRGREEYSNDGFALPDAKRTNSRKLVLDSDIMDLLEKIDNMDAISTNQEETHTAIQDERLLKGVMESLEDELGLKGQAGHADEKRSSEMGSSTEQGEITDGNSEASSVFDTTDMHLEGNSAYYDDVRAELDFFVDHTAVELGMMMNLFDENLMANIMYTDSVYGDTEAVYSESLWENDIWQWNQHPVIQNVFASQQQEEYGFSEAEFHDVWNDCRPIERLSAAVEEGL